MRALAHRDVKAVVLSLWPKSRRRLLFACAVGLTGAIIAVSLTAGTVAVIYSALGLVLVPFTALLIDGILRMDSGLRRVLVEHERCAFCLYNLAGLRPDESRLVTCPMCGGKWRMNMAGAK